MKLPLEPVNTIALLILIVKISGDAKLFFYMIRLVDMLVYAGVLTSSFFVKQIIVKSRHHIVL